MKICFSHGMSYFYIMCKGYEDTLLGPLLPKGVRSTASALEAVFKDPLAPRGARGVVTVLRAVL